MKIAEATDFVREFAFFVAMSTLFSAILLSVINYQSIIDAVLRGDKASATSVTEGLANIVSSTLQRVDALPLTSTLVVTAFWMLVGFFVYVIIISVISVLSAIRSEEEVVAHYVLPVFVTRETLIARILLNWAFLAFVSLVAVFYILFALIVGIPVANELFVKGIGAIDPAGWASLFAGPIVAGVLVTIALMLYRIVVRAGRLAFLR